MPTTLRKAIDEFKRAQREHSHDLHNPQKAEALKEARRQLEEEAARVIRRLPFSVYPVTRNRHYAVRVEVGLRDGPRYRGQTLCGAPSGRPPFGNPAPCPACLLVAERYLLEGPPPLQLEL